MSEPTPRKWYQKKRYMLPLGLLGLFIVIGSIAPDTTTQAPVQNVQSKQQQGSEVKSETVTLPAQLTPLQVQQAPSGQQESITPTQPPAVEQQAKTVETTQSVPPPAPPAAVVKPTPPPAQQQQATPPPPTYYTNVDGNKVQSPTKYDSVPAGASARCRDGTYSFSQNRRGTCSHHGGVAEWL